MIHRMAFVSFMMLIAAAAIGAVSAPAPATVTPPDLERLMPEQFGEWSRVQLNAAILPAEAELEPGEAVAYRAYRDGAGRIVTLVAAYGPPLGDSVRLHRPESCYVAQGFAIRDRKVSKLKILGGVTPVIRLNTENTVRREAVSYWLREGRGYVDSAPGHELLSLRRGLSVQPDGALIRISSNGDGAAAFALHDDFVQSFTAALSPQAREVFLVSSQ